MTARDRRGFTLVELLVVSVLGALLVGAALQVLITNQRTYTVQSAKIIGQQTTRAAMDVLWGELREVSTRGGDLLSMKEDSLTVRVMRNFSLACQVDTSGTGQPRMKLLRIGEWFAVGDSVFVFADNKESDADDDRWIRAQIGQSDTTHTCGSERAQQVIFIGQNAIFTADSVRVGAPVRSHLTYTYGLFQLGTEYYLGRKAPGVAAVPIVGPLAEKGGIAFQYRDANGAVTTNPLLVRQIVITVRTLSPVRNSIGQQVSDSVTTWIYTRN